MKGKRNNTNLDHSGFSGGHITVIRDGNAPRIVDSHEAYDVGFAEIRQYKGTNSPMRRERIFGRPYMGYWAAESDINSGGRFWGFYSSAFLTVSNGDGDERRLAYTLGSIRSKAPVTDAGGSDKGLAPRFTITDKYAVIDETSAAQDAPQRSREKGVKHLLGVTLETSNRQGFATIEEPVLVACWRDDPRHSNLVYDVRKGGLDPEMIGRLSDLVRVTVNEKNVPALSTNYGSALDDACIGHGFAYQNGIPAYLSMTRGGPLFITASSKIRHGQNVEGEQIFGAMLKFHMKGPKTGTKAEFSAANAGSYFHGGGKQGPIHYDGRDYIKGKGVRIVEAWIAFDANETASYGSCDGAKQTQGVFKMNSWVNVYDPYGGPPPSDPPPPPPGIPPEEPPGTPITKDRERKKRETPITRDRTGEPNGGGKRRVPITGGGRPLREGEEDDGARDSYEDFNKLREWDKVSGTRRQRKHGGPATGVNEERRPSHSGIPVPPDDAKPGRGIPITGGGRPLREEILAEIVPSAVERAIGVDYASMEQGTHISNSVWYERFTYEQTQRSTRNLIRAPHGAHLQLLAEYDSTSKAWVTDSNESSYVDFGGDGIRRGQTATTTWVVMPPNIDLGDSDLDPSSGVSLTGFGVHRGNDNGYIGIGVPQFSSGLLIDGFRITYDSDGVKIVAYDNAGAQDNTADIFFNGSSISGGGTSYWARTGTLLAPVTSGDDIEVDGVAAFGTASVSQLKGISIGMTADTTSDNHDGLRSALITPSGADGENNALAFTHTLQGTDSRTNARGISANVDNAATGGTVTNLFGMELTADSSASGSTITNAVGAQIRMLNTGGATHTSAYGVKVAMEDNSTTAVGVEGRIVDGTHTYASGVRGLLKSAGTYNGMGHGGYFEDLEKAASGRSAALATNSDLAFVTNELGRAYARFKGDGTDTVVLEEYDGTEAHLDVVGCVRAQAGFKMKLVEITSDNTTHNAAWGEYVVVDVASGSTGVTINLPTAKTSVDGDNVGKTIIVEAHDLGSGPSPVTVNPGGSDALRSDGVTYTDWNTSANESKMIFHAGYDRTVYAECCGQGGAFTEVPE